MSRDTYLKELERYLNKLPREDFENAMDYFTEYFDEAGPQREAEVIAELGSPREAASELLKELLQSPELPVPYEKPFAQDKKTSSPAQRSSAARILLIALLAIFAAPVGLPLAIVAVVLLFCGILVVALAFVCVLLFGVSGLFAGFWLIWQSILLFTSSVSGALLALGCSLLSIGLGILLVLFSVWAARQLIYVLARLVSRIISRKEA